MFIPQAQPHAQSLFLFPIVFGINLIHFFDFFGEKEERCSRKFDRLLCCFDPLSITPFDSTKNANRFEKCVFGNGKCDFSANQEGRNWGANFGKAQNSSPILRCTFLARRSAKLIANFSATMVTSLPSFSLCISLSLSHRMYLTHNIGNASAFPIIDKNRRWTLVEQRYVCQKLPSGSEREKSGCQRKAVSSQIWRQIFPAWQELFQKARAAPRLQDLDTFFRPCASTARRKPLTWDTLNFSRRSPPFDDKPCLFFYSVRQFHFWHCFIVRLRKSAVVLATLTTKKPEVLTCVANVTHTPRIYDLDGKFQAAVL